MAVKFTTLLCFFLLVAGTEKAAGQIFYPDGSTVQEIQQEKSMYNHQKFPSVRPYLYSDLFAMTTDDFCPHRQIFYPLMTTGKKKVKFSARLEPVIESSADLTKGDVLLSHSSIGLTALATSHKFSLQATFKTGRMNPLGISGFLPDSMSVFHVPGMTFPNNHSFYYYFRPGLRFSVPVTSRIHAEAGFDTHFFGDGKRSLILSDDHYPYPYVKFKTHIWNLQYVNLFAWHRDVYSVDADRWSQGISKFNAMHYLSWNVNKRLNISVFETVVAPLYDSLMQRQFAEYNYLLPVVMYRPVDFALGSHDNMLAGINVSYLLAGNHVLYGQFVLDEFFMSEIRSDILQFFSPDSSRNHGAWVNKQAYQLGWKYYNMFGISHLDGLFEMNRIRPYTYSHRDVQQNYTHLNRPLAHPYGANLTEFTSRLRYATEKWYFRMDFSYVKTGIDTLESHFGQDIFKPTFDSPIEGLDNIPVQYYGNSIGQGVPCTVLFFSGTASAQLLKQYNIRGEAGITLQKVQSKIHQSMHACVHFAVRWGIGGFRHAD
jgi:hypothetical protein